MEEEMATHSSIPAWRIPGMGEPGGLPSMGLHRVKHNWSDLAAAAYNKILYSSENKLGLYILTETSQKANIKLKKHKFQKDTYCMIYLDKVLKYAVLPSVV